MTNERPTPRDDLVRRALDDVPVRDAEAKERARALLRREMHGGPSPRPEPSDRGPRRWLVASVAAFLVVALFIAAWVLLPSERGGPTVTAASELRRMREVASVQPAPSIPVDGRFPIEQEALLSEGTTSLSSGIAYHLLVRSSLTGWVAKDGSGRRDISILDVQFASEADRQAWLKLGSPKLPQVGDQRIERYRPGELPFYDLSGLSTNSADELRKELQSGAAGEFGKGPTNLLAKISRLLVQPDASPELRAALFDLASTIEGVDVIADSTDPLGRPGIGVALNSAAFRSSLIIDPSTSKVLAFVDEPRGTNELSTTTWTVFL